MMYRFFVMLLGHMLWQFTTWYYKVKDFILRRKMIGRTLIPKGHSVWSFDLKTGLLDRIYLNRYYLDSENRKHEVKLKKHCRPIIALNERNAIRRANKLNKIGGYGWPEKQIKCKREERAAY